MVSKRHRGIYKPFHSAPYELSRSRIENFVKCPACFYLQQVKGVEFPSIPGFNINEATDILLKRDFDKYRGAEETHPFLVNMGLSHFIPYVHADFELWTQSMHFGAEGRMNTVHEETNLKIGGGLDDVWLNRNTHQLHIVDYKSTSVKSEGKGVTLDDRWKVSYKRQMDLYVWVMRRKGFDISDEGLFLYCDADRFTDETFLGDSLATMYFKMSLIPYQTDVSWIEPTLFEVKKTLDAENCPSHNATCEYGIFLDQLA
jgi:hypothetical protein